MEVGEVKIDDRYISEMVQDREKGVRSGHVNHLNFGGHQSYLWNGWISYRVVKFCVQVGYVKSQYTDENLPIKVAW